MKRKYNKSKKDNKRKFKKVKENPGSIYLMMMTLSENLMEGGNAYVFDGLESEIQGALYKATAQLKNGSKFNNTFTYDRTASDLKLDDDVKEDLKNNNGNLFAAKDSTMMQLNRAYVKAQETHDMKGEYVRFLTKSSPAMLFVNAFLVSLPTDKLKIYMDNPQQLNTAMKTSLERAFGNMRLPSQMNAIMQHFVMDGVPIEYAINKYTTSLIQNSQTEFNQALLVMNMMHSIIHNKLPVTALTGMESQVASIYYNPKAHEYFVEFFNAYPSEKVSDHLFRVMESEIPETYQKLSGIKEAIQYDVDKRRYIEGGAPAEPSDDNVYKMYTRLLNTKDERQAVKLAEKINQYDQPIVPHQLQQVIRSEIKNHRAPTSLGYENTYMSYMSKAIHVFHRATEVFHNRPEYEAMVHKLYHVADMKVVPLSKGSSIEYKFGPRFTNSHSHFKYVDQPISMNTGQTKYEPEYQFNPMNGEFIPLKDGQE